MIVKVNKSATPSQTLSYVYQEHKGLYGAPDVIDQTCTGWDAASVNAEMKGFIERRPEIKQPVFHGIISIPKEDHLSREQWVDVVRTYTKEMGFEDAPYVAVRHHDTDHHHVHIVASRIDIHGKLVSDSHDYYRSQRIARELEQKHELTPVRSSWERSPETRRAPDQREYHALSRAPEQRSTREHIRSSIEQSLARSGRDPVAFAADLRARDVTLVPKVTQEGDKVTGVYFEADGMRIPGSKVARAYSWPKLSKELDYDHTRDYDKVLSPVETSRMAQENSDRSVTQQQVEPGLIVTRKTPVRAPEDASRPSRAAHITPRPSPVISALIVPGEPTRAEANTPSATSREDATRHIKSTVSRASERGWDQWSDELRTSSVEPIARVTVDDSHKVRGIYFEASGHMIKGSEVGREYSYNKLAERMGAWSHERAPRAFEHVEVPGRGRESMPSPTPLRDTLAPPSAIDDYVSKARGAGYRIDENPARFKGRFDRVITDGDTTWVSVISAERKHVAMMRMEPSLLVTKAHMNAASGVTPHGRIESFDTLERGQTMLVHTHEKARIIYALEAPPRRTPDIEKVPSSTTEPNLKKVMELASNTSRVEVEPAKFNGYLVRTHSDEHSTTWAEVRSPDGSRTGFIKISSDVRMVGAEVGEDNRLIPTRTVSDPASIKPGAPVVWHTDGKTNTLWVVERQATREREAKPEQPLTTPRTSTPEAAPTRPQDAPKTTRPTLEKWLEVARANGHDIRTLSDGEAVNARVSPQVVQTREGRFRALIDEQRRMVLVDEKFIKERMEGARVRAFQPPNGRLNIRELDRSRGRDWER